MWLLCALTVALGILSKQMMLGFLILAPLFLWVSARDRSYLKSPRPYLLIVLALFSLLPPLWWNSKHNWITFQHTAHHFESNPRETFYFLKTLGTFIGTQLFVVSPLTFFLFAVVTVGLLFNIKKQGRPALFLLLFSGFPLLLFIVMSLRQAINANWPAAYYPAGMVLLSAWACGYVNCGPGIDKLRKLFIPGIFVGIFFAVLTYVLTFVLFHSSLNGGPLDPTARLKGWQQLGNEVGHVLDRLPSKEKTFLLTDRRQITSELAFYVQGQPRVYLWPGKDGSVRNQYDIWPGAADKTGWDSLIVLRSDKKLPASMLHSFSSIERVKSVPLSADKADTKSYDVYLGRNLTGWPQPQPLL